MEKEYQKIGSVFKFDEKFRTIVGLNEPYETLKNIIWQGTDGKAPKRSTGPISEFIGTAMISNSPGTPTNRNCQKISKHT